MEINLDSLPTELLNLVVSYKLNLLDLGTLLLTSKAIKERFSDIGLQQIFMENSSLLLRGPQSRRIRSVFIDSVAGRCIRNNNPRGIEVCFGKKRISSAISSVFEQSGGFMSEDRLNFVKEIYDHDADLVLSHLIKYFLDNIPENADRYREIVALASPLAEHFIQYQKPNYEQHLEQVLSLKKTFFVVLEFFGQEFATIFAWLLSFKWVHKGALPAILTSFDKFPKYSVNLNKVLIDVGRSGKTELRSGTKVTLLQYSCIMASKEAFNLLLQHGAIFDKSKPYVPFFISEFEFLEQLVQLGSNFNVALPSAMFEEKFIGESVSILNYVTKKAVEDSNISLVEYFLSKGAKFLPHELEAYLKEDDRSITYAIAKASQIENYHTFKTVIELEALEKVILEHKKIIFTNYNEIVVKLKLDLVEDQKQFKFTTGTQSQLKGHWSVQNNFLICKAEQAKSSAVMKTRAGIEQKKIVKAVDDVFKYRLVRTCTDRLAIIPDFDENLSEENLFSKMVFMTLN